MFHFRTTSVCLFFVTLWLAGCDSMPPLPDIPTHVPVSTATTQPTAQPQTQPSLQPTSVATAVPTAQATPTSSAASGGRLSKLGIDLMLDDMKSHWTVQSWPQHLRYARDLVGEWGFVEVLVRLDDLDVGKWQYFLDECWRRHLTPVFRFATFYDNEHKWWAAPIRDNEGGGYFTVAEQYRDFLDHLHWPITPRYIIVGNEPNRGDEWENQPNGEAYAHFLGDVSRRLRENDPNVVILNGALDLYAPNTNGQPFLDGYRYIDADTFMNQMAGWDKDIFKKIQIWNSHSYPMGPFNQGPNQQTLKFDYLNGAQSQRKTPWPVGLANRGINAYAWELYRVKELGGPDLQVMITETGWRHAETTFGSSDSVHAELNAQQVADFFQLAFLGSEGLLAQKYPPGGWTPWESDQRVMTVMPFALDGYAPDWGHSNWLKLDQFGFVQGTYPQYQRMLDLKGNK
jgi:hypothetical protein